ncbi:MULTISPECIES: DMT family transporter [unclassified Methylobacterium]|uniref:DMT family transporter n=1 Tax=unclassified Methylobacterium TaxID=2615210 RepID=UPI0002FAB824|nr:MULTISPECIES: DMT family transporter [unclassified Methylobacterium]
MPERERADRAVARRALRDGLIGVVIFAGSLPATRVAVADLDPFFVTAFRAGAAGLTALGLLALLRQPAPGRRDLGALALVALGVVLGWPLCTALALRTVTAAHGTVTVACLPLATALFGVWRGSERPRRAFWLFSGLGSAIVAGFALRQGGGRLGAGDAWLFLGMVLCALGYAEGARLARRLGGWQVVAWALVLSLPVSLPAAWLLRPGGWAGVGLPALASLAYVSLFSMLIGFVFWYRGLARGGIAAVGQVQLLQPFFSLILAGLVLGEPVDAALVLACAGVVATVAAAKRFA